ncbi:alpha/beta hydrolase [Altererythrobacter arenosus]|uniref:Alpha/beta hydrolase n=1 Tax=Altererythrobacter arenosus TaxID=3032592 RepID=A0ABY8FZS3_9SPHN|nr:alpha/beta hydrolase [Altererythrobacter sp. CAU 1644]WFL78886.1 alpha/beta hydrolase [Altererythrobacter sp. CAU 1644]
MNRLPRLVATLAAVILAWSPAAARAESAATSLEHDSIRVTTTEGLSLAAYVSRPTGSSAPRPALFLTQWVSCGTIKPNPARTSMEERVALAAGYALVRVDRAGTGDSDGPGCDKLDYDTEVRHYREAFDQLASHPWVDRQRMVVFGSSLGSTTAPLVALGKPVAGVIVQGAGALTYFERMLHFDRIELERQPVFDPLSLDREMRRRIEFQLHYLHGKLTPTEVEQRHPQLAGVWRSLRGTDEEPHYGRPFAWHWQAADKDWLAAWAQVEAPVMVVFGEYEQFESRHGHRVIVDTINRLRPGSATWLEIPQAGHDLGTYANPYDALSFANRTARPELFVTPVAEWLRTLETHNRD